MEYKYDLMTAIMVLGCMAIWVIAITAGSLKQHDSCKPEEKEDKDDKA